MANPAKPPAAPNVGIPDLVELLKREKVVPNEVFASAWKVFAEELDKEEGSKTRVYIAHRAISVYIAAVKQIPELMQSHVLVPSGAFVAAKQAREKDCGGILADKPKDMVRRLPKPGTFPE